MMTSYHINSKIGTLNTVSIKIKKKFGFIRVMNPKNAGEMEWQMM